MSQRVSGYKYVTGDDGKRHRLYPKQQRAVKGKGGYRFPRGTSIIPRMPARMSNALSGRGGYYDSGFVKTMDRIIPKGAFAAGGRLVGGPLGGFLGGVASKLLGFGSYKVNKNSLMVGEGEAPPMMHSNKANCRIRHREYIADVVSSSTAGAFNLVSYAIQPGNVGSFPWLSQIAQQYEEWKPLGLVYEFKTLSADAVASSQSNMTIGGVIMGTNYNAVAPSFVNKMQMDNTEYTTSAKPSESFFHPIECDMKANPLQTLYIRGGSVTSPLGDQRMYDLGNFQIATFGVAATSVTLGELWVTYEIEFSKPILTGALSQDVLSDHYYANSINQSTTPLSTAGSIRPYSTLGGNVTSGTTYNFPAWIQSGTYLIVTNWLQAAGTYTVPGLTPTNCVIQSLWNGDLSGSVSPGNTATSNTSIGLTYVVNVTGPNAKIVYSTGATLSASASVDLMVTQFNSLINT